MRILIVRTDRIGDVVLSIPVISMLRKACPEDHIAFLTRPYTRELLEGNPELNEIIGYDSGRTGILPVLQTLRQKKFDIAILLHPTFRLALLLLLSGIPVRIGTGYRFYSFLFNRRVYFHRKRDEFHEAEFNLQMLKPLFQRINQIELSDCPPKVYPTASAREWAEDKLKKFQITNRLVVIHPGNGGNAPRWSLERFAKVAGRIQKELGAKILITGGAGEKDLCQKIIEIHEMRNTGYESRNMYLLAGEASIGQLIALLEKASLLVTNSTGPMHIACALGTPVVAIFCPRRGCHPRRWGPLGQGHRVMMADIESCKKCSQKGRVDDCMEQVGEEEVFEACREILDFK